jgi:regulator of protease activity HflC (stomatin/prohibitin superfamily)
MNPITLFLAAVCILPAAAFGTWFSPYLTLPFLVAAAFIVLSLKMANAWQRFVILRAGKLQSVKGPGLFMIIPVLDNVAAVIDEG